jgi:hypothetical protein
MTSSSHAYRASGHQIEVVAVATAEARSQLGIVDRLLDGGWYVSWENHDTCAKDMLSTLAVIEAERLADRVTVVRRDGTLLYTNELTPEGCWRLRTAAEQAARVERWRPWTAPETAVFRRGLARTDRRVHTELASEDRRLAVQRDSERAAAWSEPVRRIAQKARSGAEEFPAKSTPPLRGRPRGGSSTSAAVGTTIQADRASNTRRIRVIGAN